MTNLAGVTIAFDLDNTLLDPTGERYEAVTSEFLAKCDLGLSAALVCDAYDRVRRWGSVLARLGFANPLHDRGHVDGLAVLTLLFATRDDLLSSVGDLVSRRAAFIAMLEKLDEIARGTRRGSPQERFVAERSLRAELLSDEAGELRTAVKLVSESPALREWSASYDVIEDAHPVDDVRPMLQRLIDRGAKCVVITQGQSKFQRQKIERLGITSVLSGCVLISQDARRIGGYELLDERIDELLGRADTGNELRNLWVCRCLLDVWGSKSPWFYARCLHAIHGRQGCVEQRLIDLATVVEAPNAQVARATPLNPPLVKEGRKRGGNGEPKRNMQQVTIAGSSGDWAADAIRFVMIGDRYEKDIRPVIELLGADGAMTVHLTAGKYSEDFNASDLPEMVRPTHSFANMAEVQAFLDRELVAADVSAIEAPPPIAPDGWFDEETLDFGVRSDLECVRDIANAVIATRR